MTTPVSFEIAKFLKEKGFDKKCNSFYDLISNIEINDAPLSNYNLTKQSISIPTIAEVVMWLFEKHDVYIHMSPHGDEEELLKECKWWFSIYQNTIYNLRAGCKVTPGLNEYISLPEAYEAAIEYCLTKLI